MPKKTSTKTTKKVTKSSKKSVVNKSVQREHRGLVGALALFVGFSTYAMFSIAGSNSDYLNYYSNVLKTSVTESSVDSVEDNMTIDELPFTDVSEEHKYYQAIRELYFQGMISGYQDGSFKPDVKVNRAEFAKFLIEATSFDITSIPADKIAYCATDVLDIPDHWFAPFVCVAKHEGWVKGYSDGSYGPGLQINRAEAVKIVLNAFGFVVMENDAVESLPYPDVKKTDWYLGVAATANELGLLDVENFEGGAPVSRGYTVQLIFNAMSSLE